MAERIAISRWDEVTILRSSFPFQKGIEVDLLHRCAVPPLTLCNPLRLLLKIGMIDTVFAFKRPLGLSRNKPERLHQQC